MTIKEITDKDSWEEFVLKENEKTFLQSWNWGEFQKRDGNKIIRIGVHENNELVSLCMVVVIKARRGNFLFVPHGPLGKKESLPIIVKELKVLAKNEKCSFVRIAPIWDKKETEIFTTLGFKKAPIHIHPEITWELDIRASEEDILREMRKTTRYLIRQALKNNDIEIIKSDNFEDIKTFNDIYKETAKRHKFFPFSLKYLENEFHSFINDSQILVFLGKYKGKVVSSAVVVFYDDCAFYHHGASLSEYNKIPVSYLLQWEAIKEAKKRNCQRYNFWGISDMSQKLKKNHPWHGLSLFKMGFGGERKDYIPTQDLPLSGRYFLIRIFEKIRKIKRRV